ncbi:hypothetical protein DPEC_G00336820 [Dallia pectoralis]|uniref:Uncharacterized protein n=1 Tax=Dallia pectoralis TaxID=75939 RepID=A0ACC2F7B7_DALPE|nr:hypothetical protein DPEC_G00336820 [Dallia pectoralis]
MKAHLNHLLRVPLKVELLLGHKTDSLQVDTVQEVQKQLLLIKQRITSYFKRDDDVSEGGAMERRTEVTGEVGAAKRLGQRDLDKKHLTVSGFHLLRNTTLSADVYFGLWYFEDVLPRQRTKKNRRRSSSSLRRGRSGKRLGVSWRVEWTSRRTMWVDEICDRMMHQCWDSQRDRRTEAWSFCHPV